MLFSNSNKIKYGGHRNSSFLFEDFNIYKLFHILTIVYNQYEIKYIDWRYTHIWMLYNPFDRQITLKLSKLES
ncbi:unnamed protein product [Rhizophagus irregularis]|nr:unnamed protein product [Rhizophagus irregularis]CAB4420276.1 unnamed protein product [Rhizophagus irregularis]